MLIYMQLSKGNFSRDPPSPSPSALILPPPLLLHQPNHPISQKWKPGELHLSFAYGESAGLILHPSLAVPANSGEGAQPFMGCAQPSAGSQPGHCCALLQHCIAGRLLPILSMADLGGGTWFHGSHSAAISVLGPVEAIGSTWLVRGIKRSQMLS